MAKLLGLLAAATLALVLARAQASVSPLTISPDPVPLLASKPLADAKLTLEHYGPLSIANDLVVGHYYPDAGVSFRPPGWLRDQSDFIRQRIETPDLLGRLEDIFDIDEVERPWDTTTIVHVFTAQPARGKLVPFATIAHQIDVNENFERLGLGAGAMYILQKNITFGSEVIYMGSDHPSLNGGFNREALFLTRLQIEF